MPGLRKRHWQKWKKKKIRIKKFYKVLMKVLLLCMMVTVSILAGGKKNE